jgi:hypothetical protein
MMTSPPGDSNLVGTRLRRVLVQAIQQKKLVRFVLDGLERLAEPHDYGLTRGEERLFFYQVAGASRSGRPIGWRWAVLAKMSDLEMLDQAFAGPRPVPSGQHHHWEKLIASVSRPVR